ncbi:hypothetical protein EGW08_000072, partial [Elysia chlorotica]
PVRQNWAATTNEHFAPPCNRVPVNQNWAATTNEHFAPPCNRVPKNQNWAATNNEHFAPPCNRVPKNQNWAATTNEHFAPPCNRVPVNQNWAATTNEHFAPPCNRVPVHQNWAATNNEHFAPPAVNYAGRIGRSSTREPDGEHRASVRSKSSNPTGRERSEFRSDLPGARGRREQSVPARGTNQRKQLFPDHRFTAKVSADGKTIDLHNMTVEDALSETQKYLKLREKEYHDNGNRRSDRFFNIITGQGNNSKGGKAKIKPEVEKYLNQYNFCYRPARNNPGKLVVDFFKSQ